MKEVIQLDQISKKYGKILAYANLRSVSKKGISRG